MQVYLLKTVSFYINDKVKYFVLRKILTKNNCKTCKNVNKQQKLFKKKLF